MLLGLHGYTRFFPRLLRSPSVPCGAASLALRWGPQGHRSPPELWKRLHLLRPRVLAVSDAYPGTREAGPAAASWDSSCGHIGKVLGDTLPASAPAQGSHAGPLWQGIRWLLQPTWLWPAWEIPRDLLCSRRTWQHPGILEASPPGAPPTPAGSDLLQQDTHAQFSSPLQLLPQDLEAGANRC